VSRDLLLRHYEQELMFIRRMATRFAEKYPDVAGRLLLESTKCDDPHVDRIIQAFAMLTARIQQRLDDDFSEVTDALLGILYPHFLNPVPSATVVQIFLDPQQGDVTRGLTLPRHSILLAKPLPNNVRCKFRTSYNARLFPLEIESIDVLAVGALGALVPDDARSALRIRFKAMAGVALQEVRVDQLQLFLNAPPGDLQPLYEMFARDGVGMLVQRGEGKSELLLPRECLRPMGFEPEEGMLEYPVESFRGYRLLQEYFAFPEKFQFIELSGLERSVCDAPHEFLDVSILLPQSLKEIHIRPSRDHLRLACVPALNLFPHDADPIRLSQTSVEYPVIPDVRAPLAYEVHSVQSVTGSVPGKAERQTYYPFYGIRHGMASSEEAAFWHALRRPSLRKDDQGTDLSLSIVNGRFDPCLPPTEVLSVRALCSNRDLPAELNFLDAKGDFQLERGSGIAKIVCIRKPTPAIRAPSGSGSRWRIISHLALNQLSLSSEVLREGKEAFDHGVGASLEALREILKLYDYTDSPVTRQRIAGLARVRSGRVVRRLGEGRNSSFARGVEVELELDPAQYTGTGAFLFASVLERFLGLYTSINSFTQTVLRLKEREGEYYRWPPRAGEIQLL